MDTVSRPFLRTMFSLAAFTSIFACCIGCQHGTNGDTNYDWYRGGGYYRGAGPSLSPGGQWVAYSSPRSGHGDLYEVRIDGTGTRRLTDTPTYEGEPRFSADGKHLVYLQQSPEEDSLWILDLTTLTRSPIPNTRGCHEPALSPDGKYVACRRDRPANRSIQDLEILNIATGLPTRTAGLDGTDVAWDRTGKRIYCVRGNPGEIHRVNSDGTADRVIGYGHSPSPSPDGKRVAYLGEPYNQSIWIMNSDGTRATQLCTTRSYKEGLNFTQDGRRLLYLNSADRDKVHIMLLDIRSRRTTVVSSIL